MKAIRECPYCGKKPRLRNNSFVLPGGKNSRTWWVSCTKERLGLDGTYHVVLGPDRKTPNRAINAWNKRIPK